MCDVETLRRVLAQLNGREYASYKQLTDNYRIDTVRLVVDHVRVDPYAPPSRMRIIVDREVADLPTDLTDDAAGRTAVSDFLIRRFVDAAHRMVPRPGGIRNGGFVGIGRPGQGALERTSVAVLVNQIETRIDVGLPTSGHRARGRQAAGLLTNLLPRVAKASLLHRNLDWRALRGHVILLRNQEHLRGLLPGRGPVAFMSDGAILPHHSGDSDLPLTGEAVVPFESPGNLQVIFDLPSGHRVTSMGVPEGVTVAIGGGYHGRPTLPRAIERSAYPHIGGDNREWVIARPNAVTIRTGDGRAVAGVDISPFITNLPSGTNTRCFSTTDVNGSTSQTVNLVKTVETGASTLLIDENTSTTSFMIRDEYMRALIPAAQEPITPFVGHIRSLYDELGTSTILVARGSGAFFEAASHIIAINHHVPVGVTEKTHEIAATPPFTEATEVLNGLRVGCPGVVSLPPSDIDKPAKTRSRTRIRYDCDDIDLAAVPQLVDAAQTQAITHALDRVGDLLGDRTGIPERTDELLHRIDEKGLNWLLLHRGHSGHLARPRRREILATVSRHRGLRVRPQPHPRNPELAKPGLSGGTARVETIAKSRGRVLGHARGGFDTIHSLALADWLDQLCRDG